MCWPRGRSLTTSSRLGLTLGTPLPVLHGKARDDLIFTTSNGAPLRSANFRSRIWIPALKSAGVEPLRIHDLRHTAAGLAVNVGANVKGVQMMLGHKDASMTLNVYADLFDGHLDDVADPT